MSKRCLIRGFFVALALLSAGPAAAQDRGLALGRAYVGGAIGRGSYNADFDRANEEIRSTGATSFRSSANSAATMWKGYAGYRFTPNFSVEAGYWNFGKLDLSTKISAPVTTRMKRDYRGHGIGADALLWVPVGTSWSGLVRAGALRTEVKASASHPGGGLAPLSSESASKINPHWGFGLEYRFTGAAAARLEYENIRNVGDNSKFGTAGINMLTVGANYRF